MNIIFYQNVVSSSNFDKFESHYGQEKAYEL